MSDSIQSSLGLDKPHRNEYVFSDHYLEEILRRDPVWTAAHGPAADFLAFLRERYAAERDQLAAYNEAQLEENWIKPILARLGHVWEPQASVPGMDKQIKKPDYVFFPDDETRKAAVADQRTEEYARRALAVGEVKAWPVNLSRKTAGQSVFDNNNPMYQIDYYLKATGAAWGIVGNGRFWRLVHRDSSYRLDRYFEVDLLDALTTTDDRRALAVATYFTLFFGRAAFAPDEAGRVFLDDVLAGSNRYAVALESDLRDNAYKALEQIILGFFAPAGNRLDPDNEADRAAVYRNSLLLLYRLLFLFYGESRGLLPMTNERYRERSLSELAKRAAGLVDNHKVDGLPPMSAAYWTRFRELFAIIDGRDAGMNAFLGVPRYNGGLFDPQRHEFLERMAVGERHLVRAIDYLARRRKTENGRFAGYESVDYRTLGVRQLGSIYEGLLEYKVSVAAEEMVTVRKGGKETWLPARERGKTKVIETKAPGELYLATDKGERKATGSYYTPDYIVKYIVEQTLGPLVEEARGRITNYELRITNEERAARFVEEILRLNVLDPAMGSGHFLVEATNYLARALATAELTTDHRPQTTVVDDPSSVVRRPSSTPEESDLTYWKRRVVEACIYGVDKNELAVELAKLSLWLETAAADKPLSFLDHHLRHGDSLIGARLGDLERAPTPARPQRFPKPLRSESAEPLFDESAFTTSAGLAVGGMAVIEARPTDDLDTVHAKEDAFRLIHDTHLGRWRQLADLWVSAWFGNDMSAAEYRDLALRIQGKPGGLMSDEQAARYLDHPAAADNDYFHWELEFPEVFFDRHGRPKGDAAGFDAVVGNPPYVSVTNIPVSTREYLLSAFKLVTGRFDLYIAFMELSINVTRNGGLFCFIIPIKWGVYGHGKPLRELVLNTVELKYLVNLSQSKVFPDPTTYPCIPVIINQIPETEHQLTIFNIPPDTPELLGMGHDYLRREGMSIEIPLSRYLEIPEHIISPLLDERGLELYTKLLHGSVLLGDLFDIEQCIRIGSEAKRNRLITKSVPTGKEMVYHPVIDGEHLSPYHISWGSEYLHYLPSELYNPKSRLVLHRPKILMKRIAPNLTAAYDSGQLGDYYYPLNTIYALIEKETALKIDPHYVVALLNSKLLDWSYKVQFAAIGIRGGYIEFREYLKYLPLKTIKGKSRQGGQQNILESAFSYYKNETDVELISLISDRSTEENSEMLYIDLAYLAEQMIAMHKEKQALTADFWTDLEGATDPTAFRKLRDKGKQEAGLAAELETEFLPRNSVSKSVRTLDESLAWDEAAFKGFVRALAGPVDGLSRLLKVYHSHAPRYRDLTDRIGRTDRLIDQIVYKLYGLTDEEIAIVEGRG